LKGRTPAQALRKALGLEEIPPLGPESKEEENKKDAA
jgi:hypothetical protein